MQRRVFSERYFSIPDLAIVLVVATIIYATVAIGKEWQSEFHPVTQIDLSLWALPYYTLLSAARGLVAYLVSLGFTLVVGYTAAKSRSAEKIIIPLLDILQSIPVLGFLPGLLLTLVALFPDTNTGLELTAIILIFTGQVWNMTFSYYSSLKSVPHDFQEAATMIGLSWRQKLFKVELPFSAVNLAWNSLLSMAGGWFFLIPCEAITLGEKQYRLPGIGAYMDVAVKQGDSRAVVFAVIAMILLIVLMDFVIWRPLLAWVQRFRLEDVAGTSAEEPLMKIWFRESKIVRWVKLFYRNTLFKNRIKMKIPHFPVGGVDQWVRVRAPRFHKMMKGWIHRSRSPLFGKCSALLGGGLVLLFVGYGGYKLLLILFEVPLSTWIILIRDAIWTFLRVLLSLVMSTLWAVPVGIWIGTSPRRIRLAQPVIQVLASFPAPMLYPLALGLIFSMGISFDWAAMLLMLLGVQWYVLFNVLAGALRIPQELNDAMSLMKASRWDRWRTLYLPSIFPPLVTGWITAAGGAWNASVVAEYLVYKGGILRTGGLGSELNIATSNQNFTLFAASLTLMVFIVVLLNRLVWSKVYNLAQTRYKMDM